jgi:hypothetical protein
VTLCTVEADGRYNIPVPSEQTPKYVIVVKSRPLRVPLIQSCAV